MFLLRGLVSGVRDQLSAISFQISALTVQLSIYAGNLNWDACGTVRVDLEIRTTGGNASERYE
jgi:hypothetical protein